MALNGIDPAAKTPARIRRNWNRTIKGAVGTTLAATQPIAISGIGAITLNLATNPGLTASGSALALKLDGASLTLSSSGVKVTPVVTTKGDIYTFDTANQRLGVGTNGQLLSADSTQTTGLKWINPPASSPLTTKGDLYTYDTGNQRLAVGSNGQLLVANSAASTGLNWRALVAADIPDISATYAKLAGATFSGTIAGSGTNWSIATSGSLKIKSIAVGSFILANSTVLYYPGGSITLADSSGGLWYSYGAVLSDINGNLYYSTGQLLTDGENLLGPDGTLLGNVDSASGNGASRICDNVTDDQQYLNTATLAAFTLTLPTNTRVGQIIQFVTQGAITAFTVAAGAGGSVNEASTLLSSSSCVAWRVMEWISISNTGDFVRRL